MSAFNFSFTNSSGTPISAAFKYIAVFGFFLLGSSFLRAQVMGGDGSLDLFYALPTAYTALNSDADDYAPVYDPAFQRLLFTSERSGWATVYGSESLKAISGTFNKSGQHRAFITFTENGEAFGAVFIQQVRQSYQGIVSVLRSDEALNAGVPIAGLHGEYFASHPAVSPDGTRLIFASNRQGSAQLDFWISDRTTERTWSEPVLLSPLINSTANEITPFFISNDSLLYASNGYGGKGGYDLFLSIYREGAWQEPEPLEWLNSEFDDSDATMLPDGTIVFASNRPGGQGGLDLYIVRKR
jgi:hypothetical protein